MPTARRRALHVGVNPGRRADDAFRLGEFVAQGCRTATTHRWRLALDVRWARRPLLRRRVLSWLRRRHTCRCDGNERGGDQNDRTQKAIPRAVAERRCQRLEAQRVPEALQRSAREWALTLWAQKAVAVPWSVATDRQ